MTLAVTQPLDLSRQSMVARSRTTRKETRRPEKMVLWRGDGAAAGTAASESVTLPDSDRKPSAGASARSSPQLVTLDSTGGRALQILHSRLGRQDTAPSAAQASNPLALALASNVSTLGPPPTRTARPQHGTDSVSGDTGVFSARNPVFAAMSRIAGSDPSRGGAVGVPGAVTTTRTQSEAVTSVPGSSTALSASSHLASSD